MIVYGFHKKFLTDGATTAVFLTECWHNCKTLAIKLSVGTDPRNQPVFDIGGYPAARVRECHLRTEKVVHCVGPDVQKRLT